MRSFADSARYDYYHEAYFKVMIMNLKRTLNFFFKLQPGNRTDQTGIEPSAKLSDKLSETQREKKHLFWPESCDKDARNS